MSIKPPRLLEDESPVERKQEPASQPLLKDHIFVPSIQEFEDLMSFIKRNH